MLKKYMVRESLRNPAIYRTCVQVQQKKAHYRRL